MHFRHLVLVVLMLCMADRVRSQPPAYQYPARNVDPAVLKSDQRIRVAESEQSWAFIPTQSDFKTALLFFPGGGVDPRAYAPLARSIAEAKMPVYLVRLPASIATPEQRRERAILQGQEVIKAHAEVQSWVVGGHSLGGSIAARFVHEQPKSFQGLILIGTTHPRDFDLSKYPGRVLKILGSEDRVARQQQSEAYRKLLPAATEWLVLKGANHAQFGYYGAQFGDGKATLSHEEQQRLTREAISRFVKMIAANLTPVR